jgi:hypothetical protein
MLLLEKHLNIPGQHCEDCIRKHFLTTEAFLEEAISLDVTDVWTKPITKHIEQWRDFQNLWIDKGSTSDLAQAIRGLRKKLAPLCFDVRKASAKPDHEFTPETSPLQIGQKGILRIWKIIPGIAAVELNGREFGILVSRDENSTLPNNAKPRSQRLPSNKLWWFSGDDLSVLHSLQPAWVAKYTSLTGQKASERLPYWYSN